MPGPRPKAADQRVRRNAGPAPVVLPREGFDGPQLPPPVMEGATWHPSTLRWYEAWRTSPMASRFLATDWERLWMVALLVQGFWVGEIRLKEALAEIRYNESLLGGTVGNRIDLGMELTQPPADEETGPSRPSRRSSTEMRGRLKAV